MAPHKCLRKANSNQAAVLISIITPLFNEEECVGTFLESIKLLEGDFELILVDGGSTDNTMSEVQKQVSEFGEKVRILNAERGRAVQMNEGAKEAKGDILLFLHVDCVIPKDSLEMIERVIHRQNVVGGAFRLAFSSSDTMLRAVSIFGNLRTQITKTFFGDFGIFLRKDIFRRINGYNTAVLLEDVELCRRAKKHGRLTQIDGYILASPRKYLGKGKMRLTTLFILVCLFNELRLRPRLLTRRMTNG